MDEFDEDLPVLLPPPEIADDRSSCLLLVAAGALVALLGVGGGVSLALAADEAKKADAPGASAVRAFTPAESAALGEAEYVYISSTRKDGSLGSPAEIWFWAHEGAVYVGTRPDSWRAKRIGWGRPGARISIGSRGGPALAATGALVRDQPALWAEFCEALARKYPKSWPRHEKGFRAGYEDGSRVLIRYTPVADAPAGPTPAG